MPALILLIAVVISASSGAYFVTHLREDWLLPSIGGVLFICILLGWIVTLDNKALTFRGGISGALTGFLQPTPFAWLRPLKLSWSVQLLAIFAALLLGALARLLWVVYA